MEIKINKGDTYGRLKIVKDLGYKQDKSRKTRIMQCLCDCGNVKIIRLASLRSGLTKSCGCLVKGKNTTHGKWKKPEYNTYWGAKVRCMKNKPTSKHYGDRGIKFKYKNFIDFLDDIGEKPSQKHSLDRINVNGHYEKGNCRWATMYEQARNKRNNVSYNGECALDAGIRLGGSKLLVYLRIYKGWSLKDAFTKEVMVCRSHKRK